MSDKDPDLRGLQRAANVTIYSALLSLAVLAGLGVASLIRLVF